MYCSWLYFSTLPHRCSYSHFVYVTPKSCLTATCWRRPRRPLVMIELVSVLLVRYIFCLSTSYAGHGCSTTVQLVVYLSAGFYAFICFYWHTVICDCCEWVKANLKPSSRQKDEFILDFFPPNAPPGAALLWLWLPAHLRWFSRWWWFNPSTVVSIISGVSESDSV